MFKSKNCKQLTCAVLLVGLMFITAKGAATIQFLAGTTTGWDYYDLNTDLAKNNTVDWDDLAVLTSHWLDSDCNIANLWCAGADFDASISVDLLDYAVLANDWSKQGAQNVLLQTIYGTAQDSAGNITANTSKALQNYKGIAMAFNVPSNTVLDKAIFKLKSLSAGKNVRVRFYNVTGKGYLLFSGHPAPTRNDPALGGQLLFDTGAVTIPNPAPAHEEEGANFSDLVVNFGPMQVTVGNYLLVFDYIREGSLSTACNFVQGTGVTVSAAMGTYPDGTALPKRATVSSSGFTGNTYYYFLNSSTDTNYSVGSNLFACQITTTVINQPPVVNAGADQIIVYPDTDVTLAGTVTDDGIPNPPGAVTTTWSKVSGPGDVIFGDAGALHTTATFSVFGTYVLQLTAYDGLAYSFDEVTIGPCTASNPNPVNDATDVSRNVLLTWSVCGGTVRHDVYFGTNSSDVSNSTTPTYTTSGNSYLPGTLEYLRTYYWRVDEFDGTTTSKGNIWSFTTTAAVQVPAFPTAEGAGKWARGGRGGTVYEVTNLNDAGPGSLRAAVEASGPRIVVFRISGNIELHSKLIITSPFITIAGQTAPGDGICVWRYPLVVNADDVVIRHIRCRTSDEAFTDPGFVAEGMDSLTAESGTRIIFDHCSTSWSVDENLSTSVQTYAGAGQLGKVTVQWCIIGESLNCSVHNSPTCHGYGTLAKGGYGAEYSYHHNLYIHNNSRNPYPGNYNDISVDPVGLTFDFRNNVIYNWMNDYAGYNTQSGANSLTKMNFIGNYYKAGLNSVGNYAFFERVLASRGYFSANWMNTGYPADPWSLVKWDPGWNASQIAAFKMTSPFPVSESVATDDALTAYSRVLADAGATRPKRDLVDTRLVNDVIYGTGHIINDETEVGGWPTLNSTTPPLDTDHDGMPDSWETTHGLNPNDANDNKLDRDSDGYTNIEEYLNQL